MKVSCLFLPIYPWTRSRQLWRRAEQLGLHAGYSYDHIAFEGFADGPWYGALPSLAAAAEATDRIRLGTMITSPNLRHPVLLAKELTTLDTISGGRLTAGIGAGSSGLDATALGQQPWTPVERADRYAEFVALLDELLTHDSTTRAGTYYSATDARMVGGCVQRPRIPFVIAASGHRGMGLAAAYGQGWVTCPYLDDTHTAAEVLPLIRSQLDKLADACAQAGRDPAELDRIYLTGYTPENPLISPFASPAAFTDLVGRYAQIGITELVVHWPVPGTRFEADPALFEQIVAGVCA